VPAVELVGRVATTTAWVTAPKKEALKTLSGRVARLRQFLEWFFRNRETGDITIAQSPNLALWVVIAAGALLLIIPSSGKPTLAAEIMFKGSLLVWAIDEVLRGVNPWRRCLGAVVLCYELTTILSSMV
jgi:hypothetical protein